MSKYSQHFVVAAIPVSQMLLTNWSKGLTISQSFDAIRKTGNNINYQDVVKFHREQEARFEYAFTKAFGS